MTAVLAGYLNRNISVVDEVAFDNDSGAAIAILPVGPQRTVRDGIRRGRDVVDGVLEMPPIAGLLILHIRRNCLQTYIGGPTVVIIVNTVSLHSQLLNVILERC